MTPTPPPPSPRLKLLVDRRLAGTIDRIELAELETHLLTEQGLAYYLRCAEVEAGLTLLARSRPAAAAARPLRSVGEFPTGRATTLIGIAAAVTLLITGAALHFRTTPDSARLRAAETRVAARLVAQIGVERPDLHLSECQVGQTLSLSSGIMEIVTADGTTVILEGPASMGFPDLEHLHLHHGRAVIRTAPRARLVRLTVAANSIDCPGGEIALDATPTSALVGIFEGRATVKSQAPGSRQDLTRGQSASLAADRAPRAAAFDWTRFHRGMPSRDLAWSAPEGSFDPTWIVHDVTPLIWSPGTHHARFKWTHGCDALVIDRCELRLDGRTVATDAHPAIAGDPNHTRDVVYLLRIPEKDYRRGRWTLHSQVSINPRALGQVQIPLASLPTHGGVMRADDSRPGRMRHGEIVIRPVMPDSHGVILFDKDPGATRADALGTWEYHHEGNLYRRTFFPDGTASFEINGQHHPNLDAARWTFAEGILTLHIHQHPGGPLDCVEQHLIRPDGTLSFLDRPYEDARKAP